MTGRNDQASTLGTNVQLLVETYRNNYTYPSWFNNTLGYAEDGKISAEALQNAANNLINAGHMKAKQSFLTFTGLQKKAIDQRIMNIHGDDIELLHSNVSGLGVTQEKAKEHRDSIEEKINAAKLEHQKFWDEFKILHEKHTSQEDRISQKAGLGHTHEGMGGVKPCAWYDIGCKMDEGFAGLGKLALIGGAAIIGIWLLKMRLKK